MTTTWAETPPLVYFAEPIDRAGGKQLVPAIEMFNALTAWGCGIFRPSSGFRCERPDPRIEQINREALYRADVVVAHLSTSIPSIGVPAEIEAATSRGIPAVVLYTGESFVLAGNPLVTVIDTHASVVQAVERVIKEHPRPEQAQIGPLGVTMERLTHESLITPPLVPRQPRGHGMTDPIRVVLTEGSTLPSRAYPDDAGIDLTTAHEVTIEPGEFIDVRTQVEATELPPGFWGLILGRSSVLRKWRLHVPPAVIDPGWRGPLFVGVWNLSNNPATVRPGDRLGQLILMRNYVRQIQGVGMVTSSARGTNGFGSSG